MCNTADCNGQMDLAPNIGQNFPTRVKCSLLNNDEIIKIFISELLINKIIIFN